MKKMTSNEIRNMWLNFFKEKGHEVIPSASLIPVNDDSLLWINAGVAPLKKYFDGSVVPENKRMTNLQKCIRTNDIDNVGLTKRHQTFFEMMGNFSVGDYFKEDAIKFSFELLTSSKYFDINPKKLYVTIYPEDTEAYDCWIKEGISPDHIIKLYDNFWEIGEGPCGPDSEIFYDRGEKYDKEGNALELFKKGEDNERYIEIWNNVFSQYNSKSGVDRKDYKELPSKNIDTGAGLERWCLIFQDVDSNFDTDLFVPIINKIENLSGILYNGSKEFKIIADHVRTLTFAINDGASFENVGRGYVLRRLLRRSVRMGKKLGFKDNFMYKIVPVVIDTMKEFYPELVDNRTVIETTILKEEELFRKTLDQGERKLYELINNSNDKTISGYDAFKLYDTYGFPFELTKEYLDENNFTVDKDEFDNYMEEQRNLSKNSRVVKTAMKTQSEDLLNFDKKSEFLYDVYENKSNVIGLFKDDKAVKTLNKEGYIAVKKTCFYAECGGQISDTGMIIGKSFKARVIDVIKAPNGQHLHKVKVLSGKVSLNEDCTMQLDYQRRVNIEGNHSSVHILQKALQEILDNNIHQAGSKVTDDYLRFDFTYTSKIYDEDIFKIEKRVNEVINSALTPITEIMSLEDAKKSGAMALFDNKYTDEVRVVRIGESLELCGGTHVKNTKDIKKFIIYSIESKGSNVYRIEAYTGDILDNKLLTIVKPYNDGSVKLLMKAKSVLALAKNNNIDLTFDIMMDNRSVNSYEDIVFYRNQFEYVQNELKELEKTYQNKLLEVADKNIDIFLSRIEEVNGIKTIIMKVEKFDFNILKELADNLLNKMGKGFIFFANINGNNVNFLARSNIELNAGYVVKNASVRSLGNGGGSPTFAQGGGKTIDYIDEILQSIREEVK